MRSSEMLNQLLCVTAWATFALGVKLESNEKKGFLPQYPDTYTVSGIFSLPYTDIYEPVEVFTDRPNNRQAVKYYGGQASYIYLGVGTEKQVSYESYIAGYEDKCARSVKRGGPSANERTKYPVSFLPDLTTFEYIGQTDCGKAKEGYMCHKWMKSGDILQRTNHYTFLALTDDVHTPVVYVMMGYDAAFASHYDLYRIVYSDFVAGVADNTFVVPENCHKPKKPTPKQSDHHQLLLSEITHLMHADDEPIKAMFADFTDKHNRQYTTVEEHNKAHDHFRRNHALVNSMNKKHDGVLYAANQFMDQDVLTTRYNGYKPVSEAQRDQATVPYESNTISNKALPDNVDWRRDGAVSPVKDQGACGSCWSFSAAQTIESHWFITTGQPVLLSEQQLVDCIWDKEYGSSGCDGGDETMAMKYVQDAGGLMLETEYTYRMQDGMCKIPKGEQVENPGARVKKVVSIPSGDEEALKHAVATKGPVSIAYDASHPSMTFYSEGVYYDKDCSSTDLDHAVLVVGYGTDDGKDYWLVKNSWSTYWGSMGYFKLARNRNNHCGVATSASYPVIDYKTIRV